MKKLILTFGFCFLVLSCAGQDKTTIRQTAGFKGASIPYISQNSFGDITIGNQLRLEAVMSTEGITNVIDVLGNPKDRQTKVEQAVDGTVLFETEILTYEGLRLYFSKENDGYAIGRIDFTTENYPLILNDEKIEVGMSVRNVSGVLLPTIDYSAQEPAAILYILKTNAEGKVMRDSSENIIGGYRYIKFTVDRDTKVITTISIAFIIP